MSRIRPSLVLTAAAVVPILLSACAGGGGSAGAGSGSGPASAPASASSQVSSSAPATSAATGAGRTGCDLVSRAEASAAVGAHLGAGHQAPYSPQPNIVAHSGCQFHAGTTAVGYDLNTIASSIPVSQALATGLAKVKAQGGKQLSVDGNPGFTIVKGPLQMVTFFKGHTSVGVIATNAKSGAALAIATLIAGRM